METLVPMRASLLQGMEKDQEEEEEEGCVPP